MLGKYFLYFTYLHSFVCIYIHTCTYTFEYIFIYVLHTYIQLFITKGFAVLSNVKVVSISFPDMGNETVSYLNKLLSIMTTNKDEYAKFKVNKLIFTYTYIYCHTYFPTLLLLQYIVHHWNTYCAYFPFYKRHRCNITI